MFGSFGLKFSLLHIKILTFVLFLFTFLLYSHITPSLFFFSAFLHCFVLCISFTYNIELSLLCETLKIFHLVDELCIFKWLLGIMFDIVCFFFILCYSYCVLLCDLFVFSPSWYLERLYFLSVFTKHNTFMLVFLVLLFLFLNLFFCFSVVTFKLTL